MTEVESSAIMVSSKIPLNKLLLWFIAGLSIFDLFLSPVKHKGSLAWEFTSVEKKSSKKSFYSFCVDRKVAQSLIFLQYLTKVFTANCIRKIPFISTRWA